MQKNVTQLVPIATSATSLPQQRVRWVSDMAKPDQNQTLIELLLNTIWTVGPKKWHLKSKYDLNVISLQCEHNFNVSSVSPLVLWSSYETACLAGHVGLLTIMTRIFIIPSPLIIIYSRVDVGQEKRSKNSSAEEAEAFLLNNPPAAHGDIKVFLI